MESDCLSSKPSFSTHSRCVTLSKFLSLCALIFSRVKWGLNNSKLSHWVVVRLSLTGRDYLEQLPELMEMIHGKRSISVGRYYFNNLFSLPMGELQCILRCQWQILWQVGLFDRRKNREAKEEGGSGSAQTLQSGNPVLWEPWPPPRIPDHRVSSNCRNGTVPHTHRRNKKTHWNFT